MKAVLTLVLILAPVLQAQSADLAKQETNRVLAWLQYLAAELTQVRLELHEERIEKQEAKVQALERALEQIRAARRDNEQQELMQARELARIDQQLASTLSAEERSQIEALRADLLARKPSAPADPGRHDAEAAERLANEQRRLQKLKEVANALAAR
jgi:hypothetical protein